MEVPQKVKIELPYDPAIPLLGIYPEKTIIQKRHMYPNIHCSTTYNSQGMETPKCPSTDEWIKKIWYVYLMDYYSAIKRNEFGLFVELWMDLEFVLQS